MSIVLRGADKETLIVIVDRGEKGETLDVIPMTVGQQDVDRIGRPIQPRAEAADARARIENEVSPIVQRDVDTGSVSAEVGGFGPRRGYGAPNSSNLVFHFRGIFPDGAAKTA